MVAGGSPDPEVAQVVHVMRQRLQAMRPEFTINAAFLDHCPPSGPQVISQLVKQSVEEFVLVPLQLTQAIEASPEVDAMVRRVRSAHPTARFVVSRPIGPEVTLLNILDERLREALRHSRALELDGLVLSSEGCGDVRGNALIARRARQWSTHHKLPCLTAVADGTGASAAQAIQNLRSQGRRHIAIGSFFLTADEAYHRQAELAYRFGAVAVSAPLGAHAEMLDLVLARYAFAAMELLEFEGEETEGTPLRTVG
jgi:sirohydrochlorin ferrochelatase